MTVDVPRTQHRFLIGDRGEGIKSLLAETGCAVIVPPLHIDADDKIVIRSERTKVGVGLDKVLERAAEMTLVTVDLATYTDNITHARYLYRYAKRQNLFAKMSSEGVNLTIPKNVMAENPSFIFEIDGKDATQVQAVEELRSPPPTSPPSTSIPVSTASSSAKEAKAFNPSKNNTKYTVSSTTLTPKSFSSTRAPLAPPRHYPPLPNTCKPSPPPLPTSKNNPSTSPESTIKSLSAPTAQPSTPSSATNPIV